MAGNFEVDDQDIQDLVWCINYQADRFKDMKPQPIRMTRLQDIKERLLKVDVNEF